jgi:hypothetical protein
MPLFLVLQAGWYRIVGFGLVQLRLLSGVWGLVLLGAWYIFLKSLLRSQSLALLATGIMACDTVLIQYSSYGRMDVMCTALGIAGWAAYLRLRVANLPMAVCSAVALLVASFLTHPNAIFGIAGFCLLFSYFDLRALSLRLIGWAALPVAVGVFGWGWYIIRDPSVFVVQFLNNAMGRGGGFLSPLQSVRNEVIRHLSIFGLVDHGPGSIKAVVLAAYLGSLVLVWTIPDLRRQRVLRPFQLLSVVMLFLLVFYDRYKLEFYFVNIVPIYVTMFALVVNWFWQSTLRVRPLVVVVLAAVVTVNGLTILKRVREDLYGNDYLPAVRYLLASTPASGVINGPAELGFGLGFQEHLDDDIRMGFYSGRTPMMIAIGKGTQKDDFPEIEQFEPETWRHMRDVLRQFRPVFENRLYTIYQPIPSRLEPRR